MRAYQLSLWSRYELNGTYGPGQFHRASVRHGDQLLGRHGAVGRRAAVRTAENYRDVFSLLKPPSGPSTSGPVTPSSVLPVLIKGYRAGGLIGLPAPGGSFRARTHSPCCIRIGA